DLQVELHDRPEALEERLLTERSGERAGADLLLLLGTEIEAKGADLALLVHLGDGIAKRRGDEAVGGEGADHIATRFDEAHDRVDDVILVDVDTDILRSGVDFEVGERARRIELSDDRFV